MIHYIDASTVSSYELSVILGNYVKDFDRVILVRTESKDNKPIREHIQILKESKINATFTSRGFDLEACCMPAVMCSVITEYILGSNVLTMEGISVYSTNKTLEKSLYYIYERYNKDIHFINITLEKVTTIDKCYSDVYVS